MKKKENKLTILNKLLSIEKNYKAFILDIWGVLWDGIEPYEDAIPTLLKLRSLKKPILLLSNAPRRSKIVKNKLNNIGISSKLYDKIISSGEVCRQEFLMNQKLLSKTGKSYYFIGQKEDKTIVEGLNLNNVKDINKAHFLLVCGTRDFLDTIESYKDELDAALDNNLPFVCANPDRVVIRKNGDLLICAGRLADYYASKGGKVYHFGKPYQNVYNLCLEYFNKFDPSINKKNILVVGDSLETDILGANNAGIDSLLIAEGIHSRDLLDENNNLSLKRIEVLSSKLNVYPSFVLNKFIF